MILTDKLSNKFYKETTTKKKINLSFNIII